MSQEPRADSTVEDRRTYVESTIIMTTVRILAPFVFTYGLFVMFHGASSPGGGFQGGVIVGAVVVMLGFAFGIDPTREWLRSDALRSLAVVGVLTFAGVGLGGILLGGAFLEYAVYEPFYGKATKYLIELVEVAIGAIVASVVVGLFFSLESGYRNEEVNGDGD
ncbi:MnhB domain-containing protein [Halobacteriales archaeon Cl-PHB]